MRKYIKKVLWNNNTKKTIKLIFNVYFVFHRDLQNRTQSQWPNLRQRKILFLNKSLAVRINVLVLLCGLKSIMEKNHGKKVYFQGKSSVSGCTSKYQQSKCRQSKCRLFQNVDLTCQNVDLTCQNVDNLNKRKTQVQNVDLVIIIVKQ